MAARIELSTKCVSESGTFVTGLFVIQGSSSDALEIQEKLVTQHIRDVLTAVPILEWDLPATSELEKRSASVAGMLQAFALDAVEINDSPLPLAPEATAGVSFSTKNNVLELQSDERPLGVMGQLSFPIEERLAWFMQICRTIGILIRTPTQTWVCTITRDGSPVLTAALPGNLASKSFGAMIEHSTKWSAVGVLNRSVFAGNQDPGVPDHHFRTYEATPASFDIPRTLEYVGRCSACGSSEQSKEHCVPNWIATDQKVMPVTAPIFCIACNNYFGEAVENPMAQIVRSGDLPANLSSRLFTRWAVKTAIALSLASDIRVDESWMRSLRRDQIPEGFLIFASSEMRMHPGYAFSVTQFSLSQEWTGTFLFSFVMHGLLFVVARDPRGNVEVPELSRVYPSLVAASSPPPETLALSTLHATMMERITGHGFGVVGSNRKEMKSKRR